MNCLSGFYLNEANCSSCPQNCSTCLANKCLTCEIGSYLDSTNATRCNACNSKLNGCTDCLEKYGILKCQECEEAYFVYQGHCYSCSERFDNETCTACVLERCTGCIPGYFLNDTVCSKCSLKFENCYNCTD